MSANFKRFVAYLKEHLWIPVIVLDLSVVPGIFFGRWLIKMMFQTGKPCTWERFGLKCATCGGTHCVQSLLRGDIAEAFLHNPMVFSWILYAVLTGLLLNLHIFLKPSWTGKVLRKMYSLRAFLIAVAIYLLYPVVRNLPIF